MNKQDFLLELGCDEIPARFLQRLSTDLSACLQHELNTLNLKFGHVKNFATPRRLAVLVSQLDIKQAEHLTMRQGPFIKDAYDKSGTPTLACIGFARSCGVSVDQLQREETSKGERVCFSLKQAGLPTQDILAEIVSKALKKLPMPKAMRWGDNEFSFLRPVQWVVMLFGKTLIPAQLFGRHTTQETLGHRFHHPKPLFIAEPATYDHLLYSQGYVVVDFETRQHLIAKIIEQAAAPDNIIKNKELLDEVTGLVEWPIALKGSFKEDFLKLPREVLITSMKEHQKCFAVEAEDKLKPHFVVVSNIESTDPTAVIKGNERVIHARLSDAEFFYNNDRKVTLESRLKALDAVLYQEKLGSLGDKVKRIATLAVHISTWLKADTNITQRAATLAKCDLLSEMVFEFPNLQGIMGYYYALHDGESKSVATIIKEHYLPKFSGDRLPSTHESASVALADRLDTLVGIIGINQKPSGDKDPFALRRAAQGIVRILIEKKLDVDLIQLIQQAIKNFKEPLANTQVEADVYHFILERMKYAYLDNGVPIDIFEAVAATQTSNPLDFEKRLRAVQEFCKLPEAKALIAANKRVSNILKKQNKFDIPKKVNPKYFDLPAEENLNKLLEEHSAEVERFYTKQHYTQALTSLAYLKDAVDLFFKDVMVMDEDEKKRHNRLALLNNLSILFSQTADISLLGNVDGSGSGDGSGNSDGSFYG